MHRKIICVVASSISLIVDRPCTHKPGYDFNKCIDLKFSEW